MAADEETTLEGNVRGNGFWTTERKLFALFFILGLAIGGFLVHTYIDPAFYGLQAKDTNSIIEENSRLDSRAEELYNCLLENNIPPSVCGAPDYNGEYKLDVS
ncbi:Uncharacterised protein [uncultured archaeon]|nr:Uncharacterised protein [uncultured archaeon]